MAADGEMQRLTGGIGHTPDILHPVLTQTVSDIQNKLIGELGQRLLAGDQAEPTLGIRSAEHIKLHISGESVLSHGINLAIHAKLLVPHAAYQRKQHRRMALPVLRIPTPQVLLAGSAANGCHLRTGGIDGNTNRIIL